MRKRERERERDRGSEERLWELVSFSVAVSLIMYCAVFTVCLCAHKSLGVFIASVCSLSLCNCMCVTVCVLSRRKVA